MTYNACVQCTLIANGFRAYILELIWKYPKKNIYSVFLCSATDEEFLIQFSSVRIHYLCICFIIIRLRSYFESCLLFSRKGFSSCRKSTISSARGAPPRHGKQNVLINTHPSTSGAHIYTAGTAAVRTNRRRIVLRRLHCCLTSLLVINEEVPCDIILCITRNNRYTATVS